MQERVPMLALARPVTVGHILTSSDLRTIEVSAGSGAALVHVDQAASVVGRPMATSLGPGALLSQDAVGKPAVPAAGRAVLAVAIGPGQAPPEVAAGTVVSAVVAAGGASTVEQKYGPGTSWRATVVGVTPPGTDQTRVVSLELDSTSASQLALVPAEQVALVMQPAGGGR
ncbi:flagella basal body P-ring formation protein FlgA [Amycolatopsis sp. 195334CR]|uniref:flagella basal body P-ring formation protein FlgA n=1 Tax=Amycolatopsis sp. 195334CR TaxID=2814588 RepID=UPI001F5E05C4|nr:flagella basal body P-ring formation protein FlgA [Amycolatopsis sp. 195334CR]